MSIPILQYVLSMAQFAPMVAKWLIGPNTNAVLRKIMEIAKGITKTQGDAEAVEKLRADKHMRFLFQKALLDFERQTELAVLKDKEDARKRDMAVVAASGRNKRADIMVIAAAIGLFVCLTTIVLYQKSLPGEAIGIISTIAGIFGSCLKDAYNFEFGSSRGSKEKDRTVAAMLDRNALL